MSRWEKYGEKLGERGRQGHIMEGPGEVNLRGPGLPRGTVGARARKGRGSWVMLGDIR